MSYLNNPVPQGDNNSSAKLNGLVEALSAQIQEFPVNWVLTPVLNKAPKRKNWQSEKLSREQLITELGTGRWNGVGLITGESSGGLLTVDFDGPTAIEKWQELSGGSEPPVFETLGWTSGKEGRYQLLFLVSETEWTGLENRVAITSGEKEQLEIRWNASQSVLPPSNHPETEGYRWLNGEPDFTKIAECPKWVLSLLRKQTPQSQPDTLDFSSSDIPLTAFLTLDDRALVDSGIGQGSRNPCGAKLARNLIGTANQLRRLGVRYSDSPRQLFDDYCQRCNPPLGSIEADQIWKSAEKSNPTASLTDEALQNCAKAWLYKESRPQSDRNGTQKTTAVLTHAKFIAEPIGTLEGEIDKLIEADLRRSQVEAKILDLSQRYRQNANDIRKLFRQREEERELELSREDLASEIERLLSAQKSALDIDVILPGHLATPIKLLSQRQNLKPEAYLLALLAQVNSLFKAGSKICDPFPETDWTEIVPTIFAALVAPPGAGKTPIAKSMILKPMSPLVEAAQAKYDAAQASYESELEDWKQSKEGPKPEQPAKRYYHFHSQSTLEGILLQLSKQPADGAMLFADELEGYFSGQNQYKSGKGNDKSILLSLWSGVAPNGAMRKSDGGSEAYHLPNGCNLGIFGGIQPDVLAKILGDGGDPQGEFGRFLYVSQSLSVTNLTELIGKGRLELPLAEIYQRLDRLGSQNFYFSGQAKQLFAHFHDTWCKPRILQENRPALINYLKKLPEHAARVAMGLQTLWQAGDIIDVEILKSAIAVATYSYHQLEALLMELKPSSRNLAPNLAKVLSLVQKKGEATARDICRSFPSRDRQSTGTVKQWLTELSVMGFVSVTTDGKYSPMLTDRPTKPTKLSNPGTVKVTPLSDATDARPTLTDTDAHLSVNVGHLSVNDRQTQNHIEQEVQPFVGHVGHFSDFSEKALTEEVGHLAVEEESWQKSRMKPRDEEESVNPWSIGDRARDLEDDRIWYVVALTDPLHVSVSSEPGGLEESVLHVDFLAPCSDDDDDYIDF